MHTQDWSESDRRSREDAVGRLEIALRGVQGVDEEMAMFDGSQRDLEILGFFGMEGCLSRIDRDTLERGAAAVYGRVCECVYGFQPVKVELDGVWQDGYRHPLAKQLFIPAEVLRTTPEKDEDGEEYESWEYLSDYFDEMCHRLRKRRIFHRE